MNVIELHRPSAHVAEVWLNRPEVRNALSQEMSLHLLDALRRAAIDSKVRAVVLTGAGSAFCAGGEGERVISVWRSSRDQVVAAAYQIRDGLVLPSDSEEAVEGAQLAGFALRCAAGNPGPWVLAVEHDQAVEVGPLLTEMIDGAQLERRVVDSQTIEALARLGYARCARGLGLSADVVLPDYFGTSLPRSNRNRVAAPFLVELTR